MSLYQNAPRLLGAVFLIVVFTNLSSGILLMSAVGSGSISDMLVQISNNLTLMRLGILMDMVTCVGIVVLAALLYMVLNKQHKIIALVALGLWLGEAIFVAISKLGAFALILLSLDFVKAGAPADSFYQTLGEILYKGVYGQAGTTLMWFYCAGGILWYFLFYRSRYIPRVISLFGILVVSVAFVGLVFQVMGYSAPTILVSIPILPFEITIGLWLMLRGIKDQSPAINSGQRAIVNE